MNPQQIALIEHTGISAQLNRGVAPNPEVGVRSFLHAS
jgi:hypothetical protein